MTLNLSSDENAGTSALPERDRVRRPGRWQSPWLLGLGVLVVTNLLYALPRYLQFDPKLSRDPILAGYPLQFPLIVAHLLAGNIAMVTVFLQVTAWVRRRHPAVHRISGRLYVFAGALPAALLGLYLVPALPTPTGQVGLVTEAVLWIATTLTGFRMARAGNYAAHRRWMLYSFALALGTTWSRVLYLMELAVPALALPSDVYLEVTSWLGWMINLLIAHWWLQRRRPAVPARGSSA